MERVVICAALFLCVLALNPVSAQERLPQFEIYLGGATPLSPEGFKDYYEVGISFHLQYVRFITPTIGLSFTAGYEIFPLNKNGANNDIDELGYINTDLTGHASIAEIGVGLRPYLTPATSNAQIFLFGMGTLNIVKESIEGTTYDPYNDILYQLEPPDSETKFGVALGGGIEVPAGEKFNLIFQALSRFIFNYGEDPDYNLEGDNISFAGVTAGLVF